MIKETHQKIKSKVKSYIPKDYLTEIRILYRIILETFKGVKQTGLVNLVIITIMAAILTIFGGLLKISFSFSDFINELGKVLEVSVYISPEGNTREIAKTINGYTYVEKVKIIPKAKSWNDLKRQLDMPDVDNPLPDTLHVQVNNQQNVNQAVKEIKNLSGVEDVQYANDIAKKMAILSSVSHTATLVVLIFVGLLTMFVINNTIHLVIQSRQQEIEIMRLMGVSNWYIRAPFIMQGSLYGFCGTLIALIPVNFLQVYINKFHEFFNIPMSSMSNNFVVITLFFMGMVFGSIGSIISVKKHLNV